MNKRGITAALLALSAGLWISGCGGPAKTAREETSAADTAVSAEREPSGEATGEILVEEAAPREVTITFAGDCTLGVTQNQGYEESFHDYYDTYGEEWFFDGVRDIFASDDMTLVNLECVLSTETERVEKTFNLKGKPEYVGILTGSSVEACSLGNNHTYDYGDRGFAQTRQVLESAGLTYAYRDNVGLYTTQDGVKIGIAAANLLSQNESGTESMKEGIAKLKEMGADLVIAFCHWGIERDYYPNDYQQTAAHIFIDSGADAVIGCHPHVLQGMEIYNGKIICYSLGNFCFGGNLNPSDKETMLFQQTFSLTDEGVQPELSARIIPCMLSSESGRNDFQPTVAGGEKKQTIIDHMNTYSEPYGTLYIDSEGNISQ